MIAAIFSTERRTAKAPLFFLVSLDARKIIVKDKLQAQHLYHSLRSLSCPSVHGADFISIDTNHVHFDAINKKGAQTLASFLSPYRLVLRKLVAK